MMEDVAETIGGLFMLCGGFGVAAYLLGLLAQLIASAWSKASYKWRCILQGETLIYEYRKNRQQYMKWKEAHDGKQI